MGTSLISKVDAIRFRVADLEAGLSFYRDQLGLELVWRTETEAGLKPPDDVTEIVLHTGERGLEVDFAVADAEAAARQVVAAGGRMIVPPFDIRIGRCVVVEDPWQNELVLLDTHKGLLKTDEQGWVVGNQKPE